MTDNAQKTPIAQNLSRFAEGKSQDQTQLQPRALPCSVVSVVGAIITVKFEVTSIFTLPNIAMPLFGPEYMRYPIQVGDKGFAVPSDTYLGGMSGLGGGTADLSQRGNLSTLAFLPIGNTAWTAVDPNAVTIYGPNGVVVRDTNSRSTIVLLPDGVAVVGESHVTLTCGQCSISMTPTTITITDAVATTSPAMINANWNAFISYFNGHIHTNGNQGQSTGAPVTPFTGTNLAPQGT